LLEYSNIIRPEVVDAIKNGTLRTEIVVFSDGTVYEMKGMASVSRIERSELAGVCRGDWRFFLAADREAGMGESTVSRSRYLP